jgi:hypothetical protein
MAWNQTRAYAGKGRHLTAKPWHGPVSVLLAMATNHLNNDINRFTFKMIMCNGVCVRKLNFPVIEMHFGVSKDQISIGGHTRAVRCSIRQW